MRSDGAEPKFQSRARLDHADMVHQMWERWAGAQEIVLQGLGRMGSFLLTAGSCLEQHCPDPHPLAGGVWHITGLY